MKARIDHPYPRVGVCALICKEDQLLFGLRLGSHGLNTWAPPGGKLELGESWEDCARREAREESGIRIKNIRFLTATNDMFNEDNLHYATIIMICDWAAGVPHVNEPTKCKTWGWFSYQSLPQPLFSSMAQLKQRYPLSLPEI